MFAKKDQEVLQAKADAYIDPRYEFCILGACAMTLGCRISQQNKMLMQKHFLHGQMMETTERQLFEALNGPDGYQEGVPYHFEVPEDVEAGHEAEMKAREARAEATGGVVMLNVPAPGGFFGIPPKNKVWRSLMEEGKYGPAGCGGCGADKKEDGTELLRCGKCKKRGYCGVDCQKDHWKLHKKMCTAATGGAKENGKPTVTTMADAA